MQRPQVVADPEGVFRTIPDGKSVHWSGRHAASAVSAQGKKGKASGLRRSADFCRPAIFTGILSFSIKGHMKCCDTQSKSDHYLAARVATATSSTILDLGNLTHRPLVRSPKGPLPSWPHPFKHSIACPPLALLPPFLPPPRSYPPRTHPQCPSASANSA